MAKSIGEALVSGIPVVFTRDGDCPEVVCQPGKEAQALETLDKMGLIAAGQGRREATYPEPAGSPINQKGE